MSESKKNLKFDRRIFERQSVLEPVILMHWNFSVPCKIINISEGGVCFYIKKSEMKEHPELSELPYGAPLTFILQSDEKKAKKDSEFTIVRYTCFAMDIQESKKHIKIGAATSSEIYNRIQKGVKNE